MECDCHHEFTIIGLAGLDDMKLNDKATTEDAEYILGYLPTIKQETFTLGGVYKHYSKKYTQTITLSHSYLNNRNTKYQDNLNDNPDKLRLKYRSSEQESKLRIENLARMGNWKINAGLNLDYVQYSNKSYQRLYRDYKEIDLNYDTQLEFFKWGVFAHVAGSPKMIDKDTFFKGVEETVKKPFRVVPFFDPAP